MIEQEAAEAVRSGRRKTLLRESGTVLLLLAIAALFYWKLTLTYQFDWVSGYDLTGQVLPWFEEEARQLHAGQFPLWDPHLWLGQPLLGQGQPGAAYPLNWLLFALPLDSHGHIQTASLQWYFVAIHFVALLFCYLLCRDLALSRTASILGAMLFSFGSTVGVTSWPQMLNGAVWAPLVLLFLFRVVRGYKRLASAALGGVSLGVAFLGGHHQIPMFMAIAAAIAWAFVILRGGRPDWRAGGLAVLFFLTAVLVGTFQILPIHEYGVRALRWVSAPEPVGWKDKVPYYVHAAYSVAPQSLPGIVFPQFGEPGLFVGITALALALAAVGVAWGRREVRFFTAVGLGALAFSLGPRGFFQGLLYAVTPDADKARTPHMALLLFGVSVAVLAAAGCDALAEQALHPDGQTRWPARITAGLAVFGCATLAICVGILFANKGAWQVDDAVFLSAFIALAAAGIIAAWQHGSVNRGQAIAVLLILVLVELTNGTRYLADRNDPKMSADLNAIRSHAEITAFLHRLPGPWRLETGDELPLNWAEFNNLDTVRGYLAGITLNVYHSNWASWRERSLYGVRYSVSRKSLIDGSRDIFTGAGGLKVWENPWAFPRVWTVHHAIKLPGPPEGQDMVENSLQDLHDTAFLFDAPPKLDSCTGDTVALTRYHASEVAIRADMKCKGMVILSDTAYKGWQATVDGAAQPILEVDSCLRGVIVPAGLHEIRMRYRPWSVFAGALLSVLGLVLGGIFAWAGRRGG